MTEDKVQGEGDCPYCGEHFKNVGAHLRYCKAKQAQEAEVKPETKEGYISIDDLVSEGLINIKKDELPPRTTERPQRATESKTEEVPHITMQESIETPEPAPATQGDNLKDFISGMPKWTLQPSGFKKFMFKLFNRGKVLKPCVFVSEHNTPKVMFLPYDPKKEVITNPDSGEIYDMPIKGEIAFYDMDRFRPLIQSRDPSEEYDIPEHYALKLFNLGLSEGQLLAFDDLINQIKKWQAISLISGVVAVAVMIGAFMIIKNYSDALTVAAQEMHNVTAMYGGV